MLQQTQCEQQQYQLTHDAPPRVADYFDLTERRKKGNAIMLQWIITNLHHRSPWRAV
jgi:hypothetical protein